MTYSQWESKIQGSGSGGLFFFLRKRLAIYKQRTYILELEYTDQVGSMKMKKGLWFFHINNIILFIIIYSIDYFYPKFIKF